MAGRCKSSPPIYAGTGAKIDGIRLPIDAQRSDSSAPLRQQSNLTASGEQIKIGGSAICGAETAVTFLWTCAVSCHFHMAKTTRIFGSAGLRPPSTAPARHRSDIFRSAVVVLKRHICRTLQQRLLLSFVEERGARATLISLIAADADEREAPMTSTMPPSRTAKILLQRKKFASTRAMAARIDFLLPAHAGGR